MAGEMHDEICCL